jgi:hypothetical protein
MPAEAARAAEVPRRSARAPSAHVRPKYRWQVTREARKGMNEAWFRDLNERLERRAAHPARHESSFEMVCECASEECTERIEVTFAEYEQVRHDPRTFIVVAGHADESCERVLVARERHQVVEKFGEAGEVAEIENPRDGESQ